MKSYKYILLDWDGNLAKTIHLWLESTIRILNKYNHKHTEDEIIAGLSDLQSLMKSLGIVDVIATVEEIKQDLLKKLPNIELYPDALYVLEILKSKGKLLALVTSSNHNLINQTLSKYNLDKVFDVIVAREDVKHPKPNPEPLEIAIRKLAAIKADTIMIGDSDKDVGAANNTGVDSILFFPQEHSKFYNLDEIKLLNPTYIIDDFRDVIKIIN